jgi:peptidoglycan/xylan/chitin deacetylase (PgdA/CDA1 family)
LILFRIPKSSIPHTRRPPLPASELFVSVHDSTVLCPLRSEVKLLAHAGYLVQAEHQDQVIRLLHVHNNFGRLVLRTHKAAYKIPRLFFLTHIRRAPGSFKDFRSKYAAYLHKYYYIGFRLLNNVDYSYRLVLTENLVERDYYATNNNRRGSTTDHHGFVDARPRIKLTHLFQ